MLIGIDGSRAFLPERTGIEEYSYQVVKHLRDCLQGESVFLYIRSEQTVDFELPKNWQVKRLWAPRLWTQFRLSLEMLLHPVDTLFIPAHTIPIIHPQNTVVTIHGLEYEFCRNAYSFWERWYMRFSIRYSVWVANTVIAVSENTKFDLMKLYGVLEKKIRVVYEGYENLYHVSDTQYKIPDTKYILFIGRLEERKNVMRIIEAFEILKEKYHIPHQLVLVGKNGYGFEKISFTIHHSPFKNQIILPGYLSEDEKWEFLRGADVFVFPSLYEGFGIPVLEAQSVGLPVVTSNASSLPEVGGDGVVSIDPLNGESIAEGIWKILGDVSFRDDIIRKAKKNVARFSWERCAREIRTSL